ncbi:hypothetical protein [Pseudomonas sp. dw_358]|uniref:hypothetical protein n=1 Tax=Pseudomonas sp. dw_358 TaxID=2720083 RepID=UPI001BD3C39E|nr:hypothetical protein [Pseudomonas sp. dw_358]
MKTTHLTALALATLLSAVALPALADNSTGPTNPSTSTTTGTNGASGVLPDTVGVPDGTNDMKRNGNTDGSVGNAPAAAPKGDVTVPNSGANNTDDDEDGTGSEGSK